MKAGSKMPIIAHFSWWVMLTSKVGETDLVSGVQSSVIFVLIYFLVLVLQFFVLVLVLPTTKEYQTC